MIAKWLVITNQQTDRKTGRQTDRQEVWKNMGQPGVELRIKCTRLNTRPLNLFSPSHTHTHSPCLTPPPLEQNKTLGTQVLSLCHLVKDTMRS